jgi:hypothetical protein
MNKMVNIGYRLARLQGRFNRALYRQFLPQIVRSLIVQDREIPAAVYALSCERDLPEQVASIHSFLRHVGIPQKFTIISDGSYTEASIKLLYKIHPCLEVIPFQEFAETRLPQAVYDYAEQNPMGKKLATLLSIPIAGATIYADSDILFFAGAKELINLVTANDRHSYYLPDAAQALDLRLLKDESEKINPVNGGLILLKNRLDWSLAMERFLSLKESPNYFTEQTMVHLTMHQNNALPLGSEQYIMTRDDEFIYPDKYAGNKIVLRHYVSPVRHKFWFSLQNLL